MDILRLYEDYSIQYLTEGHKHCRPGWINTVCPFCTGNPGIHLGFNISENYFYCWRCGFHPIKKTLSQLTNLPNNEIAGIMRRYDGSALSRADAKVVLKKKTFKYPNNVGKLTKTQRDYLHERGFNPDDLVHDWGLMGLGIGSQLDGISYAYRILCPIEWDDKIVSFQTRMAIHDTIGRQKYMACPKQRELIHHKQILYGCPSEWKEVGICVEGITDVWRMGVNAFATFGIEFTQMQVRQMANHFRKVAVMFDGGERQARKQANKLVSELKVRGVEAFRFDIEGDPADLAQNVADCVVNQIMNG